MATNVFLKKNECKLKIEGCNNGTWLSENHKILICPPFCIDGKIMTVLNPFIPIRNKQ